MKDKILRLTAKLYNLTLLLPKKEPLRYKLREAAIELMTNIVVLAKNQNDSKVKSQFLAKTETDFELLDTFFQLISRQHWVKQGKVFSLAQEYRDVRNKLAEMFGVSLAAMKEGADINQAAADLKNQETAILIQSQPIDSSAELVKNNNGLPQLEVKTQNPSFEKTNSTSVLFDPQLLNLDSRQRKVLKVLQEKREIQISELAKMIPDVSRRTLLRDLDKISALGFVTKLGNGRGAFYRFQLKSKPA